MTILKIAGIEQNGRIVLTPEMSEKLGVRAGESVYVAETPAGFVIQRCDAEQMRVAEKVMDKRDALLKKLAE